MNVARGSLRRRFVRVRSRVPLLQSLPSTNLAPTRRAFANPSFPTVIIAADTVLSRNAMSSSESSIRPTLRRDCENALVGRRGPMDKSDVWPMIHTERAALAADLESLQASDWDTPSLCEGWTVRDVVAHITGTAKISIGSFFPKLVSSGFSLTKLQKHDIAELRGGSPQD